MSNFALEIFDDESPKCQFYTVKLDGEELSETDKFFEKHYETDRLKPYVQQLSVFISDTIGTKRGAINDFFREERKAQALPPPAKIEIEEVDFGEDFPLRLYCMRLSSSCVILFNGGEKTSWTAQDGETKVAFREANYYADKIQMALNNGDIKLCAKKREILDTTTEKPYTELF